MLPNVSKGPQAASKGPQGSALKPFISQQVSAKKNLVHLNAPQCFLESPRIRQGTKNTLISLQLSAKIMCWPVLEPPSLQGSPLEPLISLQMYAKMSSGLLANAPQCSQRSAKDSRRRKQSFPKATRPFQRATKRGPNAP